MALLTVDSAPHVRAPDDISRIMWDVVIALLPALAVAAVVFGWYALVVVAVSTATAVATEAAVQRLRRLPVTVTDGSAAVTGMLLAFVIPPDAPLYIPVVGAFFAIAIVKHAFGGLGCNIWNPALGARAFLHFAWGQAFNVGAWAILPRSRWFLGAVYRTTDAITQATPLKVMKRAAEQAAAGGDGSVLDALFHHAPLTIHNELMRLPSLGRMFLGAIPGCLGEVSAAALLLGGLYLLVRGRLKWRIPLIYLSTVFVLTAVLPMAGGLRWFPGPLVGLYHLLAGGLMLGAIFMATDMVTSPLTGKGQAIFALGCGILTALIRLMSGAYPEGVAFSILLMNTAVPLIDRYTQPRVFGAR